MQESGRLPLVHEVRYVGVSLNLRNPESLGQQC